MMGDLQPRVLLRGLGLLVPCGTVGRGLPAGSQDHSPKAAGCHPKACGVLWAAEIGGDKLAGPWERGSCVYHCTKG